MLLVQSRNPCLIFGGGLIGKPLGGRIAGLAKAASQTHPYVWQDAKQRAAARSSLIAALAGKPSVSIVWAAGHTGFASTEKQMEDETRMLAEVLEMAAALNGKCGKVYFHHMSSAGGLFEGQPNVTDASIPAPSRPYGQWKLHQEDLVRQILKTQAASITIYRPSSVYGFYPSSRMGLISTLIMNTLKGTPTKLFGSRQTARDFIYTGDLADFVAKQVTMRTENNETFLLASGVSATIDEIIQNVAEIVQRRPVLDESAPMTNALNMSFCRYALPEAWQPISLYSGMARCAEAIQKYLEAPIDYGNS